MPLEVVGVPTVREDDGLAMSSRNIRLTPEHRKEATVLNRILTESGVRIAAGVSSGELRNWAETTVHTETSGRLRAFDIVDPETFEPVAEHVTVPVAIMMSVEFGSGDDTVLLIDQREFDS